MLNAVLNSAYGAAKAGVEMFARSLRAELAPHSASASVLYPGWTRTAITHSTQDDELLNRLFRHAYRGPLDKFSEPETVAAGLVRGLHKRAPAHLRTTSVGGIFRLAWRPQPADGRRPRQRQDHARPAPPDRAPTRGKQKPGRRACRAGHGARQRALKACLETSTSFRRPVLWTICFRRDRRLREDATPDRCGMG